MPKFYFTFGQAHAHEYNGKTFDKDCVVEIETETMDDACRQMFNAFGAKWSMQYTELPKMHYFPRGIMHL